MITDVLMACSFHAVIQIGWSLSHRSAYSGSPRGLYQAAVTGERGWLCSLIATPMSVIRRIHSLGHYSEGFTVIAWSPHPWRRTLLAAVRGGEGGADLCRI